MAPAFYLAIFPNPQQDLRSPLANTIYDIARIAGVSIATVSRAFNNPKSVSPKTRDRIMKIAEETGYHPQAFAQGLASRRRNAVAVIVPVISNYFFMEVLGGIQDKVSTTDSELHIVNIMPDSDPFEQVVHQVKRQWADGYILISVHLSPEQYEQLHVFGQPIVLLDDYHPDFDTVTADNIYGSFSATRHLLRMGAERIALIVGDPQSQPVQTRIEGYRKAMENAGLYDESMIVSGDIGYRDGFTERSGYEAMQKILAWNEPPDAVFCTSDVKGIGALRAMREAGEEIPLICYDNLSISEYMGLSTVAQPMHEMGFVAARDLFERIANPNRPFAHTMYTPELVLRGSTMGRSIPVKGQTAP